MFRLRSRDNRSYSSNTLNVYYYEKYPSCSDAIAWRGPISSQTWNNIPSGKFATMRDVTIPGYQRRAQKGEVFFNPCSRVEIEINNSGSDGTGELTATTTSCSSPNTYYRKIKHELSGDVGRLTSGFGFPQTTDGFLIAPSSILDPSDLSALRTEVSTACLSNIGKSDSNLYESLAEADKALGTLPSIFKNAISVASRPGFGKAKAAGNAWLAYRYGLKPIMNDVESVMLGLKALTGRVRRTYRSQGSITGTKVDVNNAYSWASAYTCKQQFTHSETVIVRAMSLNEYYASVMSNIGFTTKGLLTLPWELVPYSFVVDWFVNVGDVIGALVPDANMTQLGSCLVTKRELTTSYSIESLSCVSGYSISRPIQGNCHRIVRTYTRDPGPLISGLVVKSDFRFSNLTRSLDALALLVQKLRV